MTAGDLTTTNPYSPLSLYLEWDLCLLYGGEAEKHSHGPEPQQGLST